MSFADSMEEPRRLARLTLWSAKRTYLDWAGTSWFALTLVSGQVVAPLIGLFVWSSVFPNDNDRVTSYYVALMVVQLMSASYENHTFSGAIYDGGVSHELLQPKPVVVGPLGANLAVRLSLCLLGAPIVLVAGLLLHVSYSFGAVLLAFPAVVLAMLLRFLFTWVLALTAFWTERVHAVTGFGGVLIFLLGGSAAPVMFLPEPLRSVAAALPFRAMLGFPAELATRNVSGVDVLLGFGFQLGWIAVLGVLAVVVWRAGVRRYTAVGS
ncbi:ABC transporter permease [Flindersiella endophytica]